MGPHKSPSELSTTSLCYGIEIHIFIFKIYAHIQKRIAGKTRMEKNSKISIKFLIDYRRCGSKKKKNFF